MPHPIACLDACVLAPPALCDLLLRLAETEALYRPVFSQEILEEVKRTQMTKFKRPYTEQQATFWSQEVTGAFPEALVTNYREIIPKLENDVKDRHVLAAAIQGQAQYLVTANLKDFREEHLDPWNVVPLHPQTFLLTLFESSPERILSCLSEIAHDRSQRGQEIDPRRILDALAHTVPEFSAYVAPYLG